MIKIRFQEPTDSEWQEWKERCKRATRALCEGRALGTKRRVNKKLYKAQRQVFLAVEGPFHGKCAYCESLIAADQPGDIEHFRPQQEVTNLDHTAVMVLDARGGEVPHPGYYWLAYEWRNLLPACRDCNSLSNKKTAGKLVGKGERFPVKGHHAQRPGEESEEQPLLINSADEGEDPSLHLDIGENGVFLARTDRGEACIEVFGLNDRTALVACRADAYGQGMDSVFTAMDALLHNDPQRAKRHTDKMKRYQTGDLPYSAAARAGISRETARIRDLSLTLLGGSS